MSIKPNNELKSLAGLKVFYIEGDNVTEGTLRNTHNELYFKPDSDKDLTFNPDLNKLFLNIPTKDICKWEKSNNGIFIVFKMGCGDIFQPGADGNSPMAELNAITHCPNCKKRIEL